MWPTYSNEAADLVFTSSATSPSRVIVTWHAPPNASPAAPTAFDLKLIPTGWLVTVYAGCGPSEPGCSAPQDTLEGGFAGGLRIDGALLDYSLTLCFAFQESAMSPMPKLQAVRLWAGDVPAAYDWN